MLNKKTLLIILIIVPAILNLSSCSNPGFAEFDIILPKDVDLTTREVMDKIPLTAGLYINPHLSNLKFNGSNPMWQGYKRVTYYIGDAFNSNTEKMLRNIFHEVIVIEDTTTGASRQNMDILITPTNLTLRYIYKDYKEAKAKGYQSALVQQMIIKWDITSPDGKIIYTNTITGEAWFSETYKLCFSRECAEEVFRKEMLNVMKKQLSKAQDDIYTNTWWNNPWWKSSN